MQQGSVGGEGVELFFDVEAVLARLQQLISKYSYVSEQLSSEDILD